LSTPNVHEPGLFQRDTLAQHPDLANSWRNNLGVFPWWLAFIQISADVVVTLDLFRE
jgi:hypothetical protein